MISGGENKARRQEMKGKGAGKEGRLTDPSTARRLTQYSFLLPSSYEQTVSHEKEKLRLHIPSLSLVHISG